MGFIELMGNGLGARAGSGVFNVSSVRVIEIGKCFILLLPSARD